MKNLEITQISIYPVANPQGKLKAFVRIVLNDCLQLSNMRIYEGHQLNFVSYPVESMQKGDDFRQVFYPTTKEFREYIQDAVLKEYENLK